MKPANKAEPGEFPGRNDEAKPRPLYYERREPVYEVEAVLVKRCRRKAQQYLVKWLGYPESENSWVPRRHLHGFTDAELNAIPDQTERPAEGTPTTETASRPTPAGEHLRKRAEREQPVRRSTRIQAKEAV